MGSNITFEVQCVPVYGAVHCLDDALCMPCTVPDVVPSQGLAQLTVAAGCRKGITPIISTFSET